MIEIDHEVRLGVRALLGHAGLFGPSGAGKTRLAVLMLLALIRAGIVSIIVLDKKRETITLFERSLIDLAKSLPRLEAEDLLNRVAFIDPTSPKYLPRLNILALEPGADTEAHVDAVNRLITDESDLGGLGIRQEPLNYRILTCLHRVGLPLTAYPDVVLNPGLLESLAETSPAAELLRATAARLRAESRDRLAGLLSRSERLLRLKSTRLALGGAPDCIDFVRLMRGRIVLVNLEPSSESEDDGQFITGIFNMRLTRAIRRLPNGSPPCVVLIEEAPAFLSAGPSRTGDMLEDTLRLARSKGVFLWLLSQDLTSLGKVSATLPTVIRTNAHLLGIFRTTDDWSHALPVTGRRLRRSSAPWQEPRVEYLERGAELNLLREELARLEDRRCYLVDRRRGLPGVLMRTADLSPEATDEEVQALEERASQNDAVLSVEELERGENAVKARIAALLKGNPAPPPGATSARPVRRRGPQPIDIG
jgi:hypothetical protein